MMRLCTPLILMLALYQVDSSDRQKVFGNLHETLSLPCPQSCSGLLTWTMFQRQDDVLVRCTRDSCRSKAGFSLNHDQFLRGDSALTVLRADYSLRGLYRAECDSETLCQVVFTLNPQELAHNITPGEHINVYLPLTDEVKVNFIASDPVQPTNQKICTVKKDKIDCIPDYKGRSSLRNTLQIKDGNFSDSGNYTVWDTVNNEIIANVHITVKESEAEQQGDGSVSQSHRVRRRSIQSEVKTCPVCNPESSMPAWASALIAVLVILVILFTLSVLVIVYQWREIQKLREGPADSTHQQVQMTENTSRHQQNGVNGRARPNPDVEMSVHTPLTEQQH